MHSAHLVHLLKKAAEPQHKKGNYGKAAGLTAAAVVAALLRLFRR